MARDVIDPRRNLWPLVLEARKKGTPVICIDPIRTRTAEQCDECGEKLPAEAL